VYQDTTPGTAGRPSSSPKPTNASFLTFPASIPDVATFFATTPIAATTSAPTAGNAPLPAEHAKPTIRASRVFFSGARGTLC